MWNHGLQKLRVSNRCLLSNKEKDDSSGVMISGIARVVVAVIIFVVLNEFIKPRDDR